MKALFAKPYRKIIPPSAQYSNVADILARQQFQSLAESPPCIAHFWLVSVALVRALDLVFLGMIQTTLGHFRQNMQPRHHRGVNSDLKLMQWGNIQSASQLDLVGRNDSAGVRLHQRKARPRHQLLLCASRAKMAQLSGRGILCQLNPSFYQDGSSRPRAQQGTQSDATHGGIFVN